MKDFFKELNIIDILGIGVPGCLLVLLLGGDQTAELLWMEQFGNHPLAFGIVLIVVGALVGMLIQELGDMIEKGLWLNPLLDPKVYAACAVNTTDLNVTELTGHQYSTLNQTIESWLYWASVIAAGAVVLCASVLLNFAMWRSAFVTNPDVWVRFPAWLGLLPLPIVILAAVIPAVRGLRKLSKDTAKWNNILLIRSVNPYIQTRLVGHGNTSKRTLFDGWRFVMRNLILVLAITNLVSLWKPLDLYRRVASMMVGANNCMNFDLAMLSLFASCAMALMLVRYYHYAFLRYKYSLENYMQLCREEAQPNATEAVN